VELAVNGVAIASARVLEIDGGIVAEAALQGDSLLGVLALLGQVSLLRYVGVFFVEVAVCNVHYETKVVSKL
jgi:hypothetical protein